MNEHLQFLQAFLKNPLYVGAISPSSPELARAMIRGVEPDENNVVLEIGVGTGAITKFLQPLVPNEKSYIGIEIDQALVETLHEKFPELLIVHANACNAAEIVENAGMGKVSYIISGLPFASLPKNVREGILAEVEKFMEKGCMFRTFQYAHGYLLPPAVKFREYMNERYGKPKRSALIVKNVPPAYTLTWKTD
mgnify:CR=1 FL=1|jgi:Phospholipid N-methyltransferase